MVCARSVVCAHFISDSFLQILADFWQIFADLAVLFCINLIGVWWPCFAMFGSKVGAKSMDMEAGKKNEAKGNQLESTKWRHNGSILRFQRTHFFGPDCLIKFGRPLANFWYVFCSQIDKFRIKPTENIKKKCPGRRLEQKT